MMVSLAGLDYDERGAGEAVCLVHAGVFSAWFAPRFEQPALDGFRVVRPIRPGYGRGPAPSEPASIAAHARRCGELLRGLGVTRVHWVGGALLQLLHGAAAGAGRPWPGVGGDGYPEVLLARFGADGLAEAEREPAYFFADELPAVGAWTFGPAEAARITAAALLLRGAGSRPWFRENVEILAELLPDARTQTLPELDHLAPLTNPAELASAIAAFVR